VKWQTRAFEGRMPQGMGVRVPPRAVFLLTSKAPQSSSRKAPRVTELYEITKTLNFAKAPDGESNQFKRP